MITYPTINPIALQLGPVKIHWYGLMYVIGFLAAWLLGVWRAKRPGSGWTPEQVGDVIFYGALGVIIGGRLGYMIFYAWPELIHDPLSLFRIWQGGMSFHGGLIGALIGLWLFARRHDKSWFTIADFVAPLVPVGLGAGRIGNFINGELWGRVTDVPWAMVFPRAGAAPRHPSQLYEFLLEGVLLFIILWWFSSKPKPRMAVSGLFLLGYGAFRFFVEFYRQPDVQIGFVAFDWMTKGQLLCIPMILLGILFLVMAYRHKASAIKEQA